LEWDEPKIRYATKEERRKKKEKKAQTKKKGSLIYLIGI